MVDRKMVVTFTVGKVTVTVKHEASGWRVDDNFGNPVSEGRKFQDALADAEMFFPRVHAPSED